MKKNLRYLLTPYLNSPDLEEALTNSPKLQSAEWSVAYNPTQSEPLFAGLHTNLPSLEVSANLPIADAQLVYDLLYHLDKEDGWDNIRASTDASYLLLEYLDNKRADELVNVLSSPSKRLPDSSLESVLGFDASSIIPLISPSAYLASASIRERELLLAEARVIAQQTIATSAAFKVLPPRSFSFEMEGSSDYRAHFTPQDKESSASARVETLEAESAILKEAIDFTSAPFKKYELEHKDSGGFFRPSEILLVDTFLPELMKGSDVQEQFFNALLSEPLLAIGQPDLFNAASTQALDARKQVEKTAQGLEPVDEFTIVHSDTYEPLLKKPFDIDLISTEVKDLVVADIGQVLPTNKVVTLSEIEPLRWDLGKTFNLIWTTTYENELRKPVLDHKAGTKIGDLTAGQNAQIFLDKFFPTTITPKKHHLRFNIPSFRWNLDAQEVSATLTKRGNKHPLYTSADNWTDERYEEHVAAGSGDEGPFYQEGTNAGAYPPLYYWYVATPSFEGEWRELPHSVTGFRDPMSGGRRVNTHIREMTPEDLQNVKIITPGDLGPGAYIASGKTYVEKLLAGDYGDYLKKIPLSWGQFDIGLQPNVVSEVSLLDAIIPYRFPTMDPAIQRSLMNISFIDRPYALANDIQTDVNFSLNLGVRQVLSGMADNKNHHTDGISIFSKQWGTSQPYARGIFDVKPPILAEGLPLSASKAETKSEREPLFFHKRAQQQPPTILGYDQVNLKIKAHSEREADGGDPFMRFMLYATISVPEQIANAKNRDIIAAKTFPFLTNEASFIDSTIGFKYAPKRMKEMVIELDDFFTRKGDFQRDLPENNVQASSGPGSAFKPIYCPGYFLEAYVGEPGSHASF